MSEIRLYELGTKESNIYMDAMDKAPSGSGEQAGIDAVQAYRDSQKPKKKKKGLIQMRREAMEKESGY